MKFRLVDDLDDRLRWDEMVLKSMKMIQAKAVFAVRGCPKLSMGRTVR